MMAVTAMNSLGTVRFLLFKLPATLSATGMLASICIPCAAQEEAAARTKIRDALMFHVSFDESPDADHARGDRALYHAPAMNKRDAAVPGLPAGGEVKHEPRTGRFGGALKFNKSKGPMVFFKADRNFPAPAPSWSGTVAFWLNTDPANDLPDGFCDPIQITSKQWDDAAMFVEFEKRATGIPFRLGVYADKAAWNPAGRKFDDIPASERPLITVPKPPFAAGKWTHVAFSFSRFNTGRPDGTATLYLDGKPAGSLGPRTQTFTWDAAKAAIMPGLNFIGLMDEFAVFDRALSADEIGTLFALKAGVAELKAAKR
jgi:Concanavalin A-like lectin/glucanases superfamily